MQVKDLGAEGWLLVGLLFVYGWRACVLNYVYGNEIMYEVAS